jgi:Mn2+/Fe2+ NRAMP family transporter
VNACAGFVLVWRGGYAVFEKLMKLLMGVMFLSVVLCALLLKVSPAAFFTGLLCPTVPAGSASFLLGVMGGVGGSVTLLCYGYWIREKGWQGGRMHGRTMLDLGVAYGLTGIFGLSLIVIAAGVHPADASGNALVLALAGQLGALFGPAGRWCFLIGFWSAVFTSLLGVWQGVPYLFADYMAARRRRGGETGGGAADGLAQSRAYRWFLGYLAFPPLLLLLVGKPVTLVIIYAVAGAFFMPFLASVLLVMNNRAAWVGTLRNRFAINLILFLSLVLFSCLFLMEAWQRLGGGR